MKWNTTESERFGCFHLENSSPGSYHGGRFSGEGKRGGVGDI